MKRTKHDGIPDIVQFKRMLRERGLKATPQRVAVHEAMLALVHAGADGVADYIAEQGRTPVSPASVYNILTMLADLKIYGRRSSRSGKMVFDVRTGRHLHLYDTRNQVWRDLEDETLFAWLETHFKGRRFRGYRIDGFEVQILCHPTRTPLPGKKV
ncbi:MAG: transcriptional repressor [Bacteroidales bacterium]|nr:transcriptional repressor [Bacteroidales bacterium]